MRVIERACVLCKRLIFLGLAVGPLGSRAQGTAADISAWRPIADSLIRAGRAAEAAGNSRGALALYSRAVRYAAGMTRAEEDTLHAIIFRTAARLTPAPALPDSAMVYEIRAQAAFDSAKTLADFRDAAAEYNKAILSAPWIPRFYYNLAVLAERSGDLPRAADLYREYLLSPQIDDRDAVRRKLIILDYERERAVVAEDADKKRFAAFDEWIGEWQLFSYYDRSRAGNKYIFNAVDTSSVYEFTGCCGRTVNARWTKLPVSVVNLVRRLDTLYVEFKGAPLWRAAISGSHFEDLKWYNVQDKKEIVKLYAACEYYEPSGLYHVAAKIVRLSSGNPELHFVSAGIQSHSDGTCAILQDPTIQYALVKP